MVKFIQVVRISDKVQEKKWDGKYPTTLVSDNGASILLNTGKGN